MEGGDDPVGAMGSLQASSGVASLALPSINSRTASPTVWAEVKYVLMPL
ncbi:unnamed protein product [marine sediment metagenome]|uniref:Uncharacterized protein n=1 Tax=marine sediment metagenome TaxID=412755 RepID=X1P601_9ZZZZ